MSAKRETIPAQAREAERFPEPLSPAEWDRQFRGVLDSVGIIGGAANVIMQLALAGVGRGVLESPVESGAIFKHPIKRARTTLTYLAVALLGNTEEKLAYRKAIDTAHRQVRSTEKSPVKYHALDPNLQMWVASCLVWGLIDTWEKLWGPADRDTRNRLYLELAPLGTTLQVRPDMWPETIEAFESLWEEGLQNVSIDPEVRKFLNGIADIKFMGSAVSFLFGPLNRFLTAGLLPEQIRQEMQWEWTDTQQQKFDRSLRFISAVNRRLPFFVRTVGIRLAMWDFRRRMHKSLPMV